MSPPHPLQAVTARVYYVGIQGTEPHGWYVDLLPVGSEGDGPYRLSDRPKYRHLTDALDAIQQLCTPENGYQLERVLVEP